MAVFPLPPDDDPGAGREFDFLISYAAEDHDWAQWISWTLENAGYRVYFRGWDAVPGSHALAQDDRGMAALQTIAVVTAAYLAASGAEVVHQLAARNDDPSGTGRRLVPVRVTADRVSGALAGRVSIDLFGRSESAARERLLAGIESSRRGRAKPEYQPSYPATLASPGQRSARGRHPEPRFPVAKQPYLAGSEQPRDVLRALATPVRRRTPAISTDHVAPTGREPVFRHTDDERVTVLRVGFAPAGGSLVTCGSDGRVAVWDLSASGSARKPLAVLRHPRPVRAAVFSPVSDILATCCEDGNVRLWDLADGQLAETFTHPDRPLTAAFSPDGSSLVTVCEVSGAYCWEVARGAAHRQLVGTGQGRSYTCLEASSNASAVAVAWRDETGIELVTVGRTTAPGQSRRLPSSGEVRELSFSRDGRWLATRESDHEPQVWETTTGRQAPPPRQEGRGRARWISLADDGRLLAVARTAVAGSCTIDVMDVTTGETTAALESRWLPRFLVYGRGGEFLATHSPTMPAVRLHRLTPGAPGPRSIELPHRASVASVAFSPNGQHLAAASGAGVTLWDIAALCPEADLMNPSKPIG